MDASPCVDFAIPPLLDAIISLAYRLEGEAARLELNLDTGIGSGTFVTFVLFVKSVFKN